MTDDFQVDEVVIQRRSGRSKNWAEERLPSLMPGIVEEKELWIMVPTVPYLQLPATVRLVESGGKGGK